MNQLRLKISLAFVVILVSSVTGVSQQAYKYDFLNSLTESGGSGPSLNPLGTAVYTSESLPVSCLSRPVYSFIQNDGLQFDNGAAGNFLGTAYSIEMYFRFTNNSGFFRIIDFKNRTSDLGLYGTATQVQFFDELTVNNSAFGSNTYVHLVLTRNSVTEEVNIYINGTPIGSFIDASDKALPSVDNVINFFRDDIVFGNEAQPGRIALLKLYDYELSAGDVSDNFDGIEQTSAAVAFSASPTSACLAGNLFNFTNQSQNSGGVTYSWEFGDGNTAAGSNASHSYTAQGNYTVLLIADNGAGCTDSASVDVAVGGQATIAASGPTDICAGGSVTLSASPGLSYLWSTGATSQDILVTTAGTYTVAVDYGNGCVSTADPVTVNVSTSGPGSINYMIGSSIACAVQSLPYTINQSNRALYYIWTLPSNATISGLSSFQTTDTTVTIDYGVGFSGGVVEVRAYNGCGVRGPRSKTITSTPPLTPAPISGTAYACAGNTYTYSTTLRPGVDFYNWTAPAGAIITGQGSNQVNITFPIGFTSGFVRVVAQNPCGNSNQRSLFVRSKPLQPGIISGPTSGLCGSVQTYSISPVAGATSYTWTAPSGSSVISGQGTTSIQIQFNNGLNTGFVRVTADNPCGSSSVRRLAVTGGVVVSDDPDSLNACTGDQVSFTVAVQNGTGLIYQWRKDGVNLTDGGAVSGATGGTLVINPVDATWAGLYDCIVRRSCGLSDTSAVALMQVDLGGSQPGPISGPGVACEGDQWDYSIAPVPGATSYDWSGDAGVTVISGQGTETVRIEFGPTPLTGYEIYVQAVSNCGVSDTTQLWVRQKLSTPNFTTAPTTVCDNTSGVVFEVGTVPGADSYTWTAPANATVSGGQGTSIANIDFGPGFTSGQVCVTATNACFTTPSRCINITSLPDFPGNIQGASYNVCNSQQVYSINTVANATSFNWSVPAGATIASGQGTNSATVDFGPTYTGGNIEVQSVNTCGSSAARSRIAYPFPTKPVEIFGDPAPCANSTGNIYSINPVAGASSYVWTVPSGSTITSGGNTNSITVDFGSTAGNITASAVNACGTGFAKFFAVSFSCRNASAVSSVSEVSLEVHPNPATENVKVVAIGLNEENVSVTITDLTGREVQNVSVARLDSGNQVVLDIRNVPAGIYLVKMEAASGVYQTRFVKE
jgi:hypothetical protein